MAIRCSIMGCEYDDTFIERDEQRRGEEVILTVREFKECAHCGNTELISENTGVTAVVDEPEVDESEAEPDDETAAEPDDETAVEPDEGRETTGPDEERSGPVTGGIPAERDPTGEVDVGADEGTVTDDAVVLGDSTPDVDPETDPSPPTGAKASTVDGDDRPTGAPVATDATATAADDEPADDAVFLETTATEGQRPGGIDETVAMEDGPSITGAIREAEEEYPEDDAVILESSGDGSGGQSDRGGWPDHDGEATREWPEHDDALLETDASTGATAGGWPADEGIDATPRTETGTDVAFSGLTPTAAEDDAGTGDGRTVGTGTVPADRPLAGRAEPTEGIDTAGGGTATASREAPAESESGSGTDAPADDDPTPGATPDPDPVAARDRTTTAAGERRLHCGDCDNEIRRSASPHRAGDICPDCGRGYLQRR